MATATKAPKTATPADDVTENADAATTPAEAFGTTWTLQDIDPSQLVRDEANARPDTPPDADLIASVKAIGVQEVVGVRPRPDGTFGVFKGWRRSQAAQLANDSAEAENQPRRSVSCAVHADLVGRDAATRLLSLLENDQREGMTERDKARAVEQIALDMSDAELTQAAGVLNISRTAMRAAKRAQKLDDSTLRRASAAGMDLEQMAELAEVADVQGADRALESARERDEEEGKGGRGHWDHAMARLRETKALQDRRTATLKELEEAKIPLLPNHPRWGEKDHSRRLSDLTTGMGNPLTEENHAGCPGHSARMDADSNPVWHCTNPSEHGHRVRPGAQTAKKMNPEEKERRARTIAGNRAWKAAREVRKEFIRKFIQGKSLPDDAVDLALTTLLTRARFYADYADKGAYADVARFLGVKDPGEIGEINATDTFGEVITRTGKARKMHLLFAHVAAAFEHSIRADNAWQGTWGAQPGWLLWLEAHGYTLSEVENEAVAKHRPKTDADAADEADPGTGTDHEAGEDADTEDEGQEEFADDDGES